MSATTLTPNESVSATVNGTSKSPVDFVRTLPPEQKQAVFVALLREALQLNGDGCLLPIDDENGKPFGYYVSSKVAAEQVKRLVPPQTEEDRERTRRALATLDNTFEMDEFLNQLDAEDAVQG